MLLGVYNPSQLNESRWVINRSLAKISGGWSRLSFSICHSSFAMLAGVRIPEWRTRITKIFEVFMDLNWRFDQETIDWHELSNLYRIAPLGDKKPEALKIAFSNSRFKCFVFDNEKLIGAGRALADGIDCSYLCDVTVHPDYQGLGLGKEIINKLKEFSAGHKKIILYANPGKEGFYKKLGFLRMRTAMAIFQNQVRAIEAGLIDEE
jgi:ribosomal protein S18 acetylase RimI-like enzyme